MTTHLMNLTRHINLVRDATMILGQKVDFGRILIGNGFVHDASKFHGIEWDYLHQPDARILQDDLDRAIRQHVMTNPHHPEYWGGIELMPHVYVAEMVCDWYARSQEFGTDLRKWIATDAYDKYMIPGDKMFQINMFVDLLLEKPFGQRHI